MSSRQDLICRLRYSLHRLPACSVTPEMPLLNPAWWQYSKLFHDNEIGDFWKLLRQLFALRSVVPFLGFARGRVGRFGGGTSRLRPGFQIFERILHAKF